MCGHMSGRIQQFVVNLISDGRNDLIDAFTQRVTIARENGFVGELNTLANFLDLNFLGALGQFRDGNVGAFSHILGLSNVLIVRQSHGVASAALKGGVDSRQRREHHDFRR